jgi:thioester reductase-like protein
MFTSSISTAQNWDRSKGPFPEEVQYDAGVAEGLGYGASKYVSERVSHRFFMKMMYLTNAAILINKVLVNSKLPATSFRIGQISGGPPRGAWSTTDWLPIIVKSSVSLGALPETQEVS